MASVPGARRLSRTGSSSPGPRRQIGLVRPLLSGWALFTALFLLAPLVIVFVNSIGVEQYVVFPPGGGASTGMS